MEPIVDGLEKQYGNRMTFIRVNLADDQNDPIADQYHVQAVPSIVIIDRRGKVGDPLLGRKTSDELAGQIDRALQ